jgi:hypothetical protein
MGESWMVDGETSVMMVMKIGGSTFFLNRNFAVFLPTKFLFYQVEGWRSGTLILAPWVFW